MLEYLIGTAEFAAENVMILNCANMGYQVNCSMRTVNTLCKSGEEVKVYTYLSLTESGIVLYGFMDKLEREMFFSLTSVSKIGPKAALNILSVYSPNDLAVIINSNDIKALCKCSGIGKKLAEAIIFNLKDKFALIEAEAGDFEFYAESGGNDARSEAVLALEALGFDRLLSRKLIASVYDENLSCEELISRALASMVK